MKNIRGTSPITEKPEWSWVLVGAHFALLNILAWVVVSIPSYHESIEPLINMLARFIPAIIGMGRSSPDIQWGAVFFLLCLLSSPVYLYFFWKAFTFSGLPFVKEFSPIKFWLTALSCFIFAFAELYYLKPSNHAANSVRAVHFVEDWMRGSYLIYGMMAYVLAMVFALFISGGAKATQLRLNHQQGITK